MCPGDPNSEKAIGLVKWGPNEMSADGTIRFQDVRTLKRHFGSLPNWLTVVPTLGDVQQLVQYPGSECINFLQNWRREWDEYQEMRRQQPASESHVASARGYISSDVATVDPMQPVTLPPDPRDVLEQARNNTNNGQQQQVRRNNSSTAAAAAPLLASTPPPELLLMQQRRNDSSRSSITIDDDHRDIELRSPTSKRRQRNSSSSSSSAAAADNKESSSSSNSNYSIILEREEDDGDATAAAAPSRDRTFLQQQQFHHHVNISSAPKTPLIIETAEGGGG